jgi:TatD DNase family protein
MESSLEPIVDTHAHLDFSAFDEDREAVLRRAEAAGVRWIVNPGADIESSRRAIKLVDAYAGIYAAVGIHPHDAKTVTPSALRELRRLAGHPKVVAIGEIGLDYYRDLSPRDVQREAFRQQLELAGDLGLPVIVHDRDAHDDVLRILEEWNTGRSDRPGLFHAFSGDVAMAQRVVQMGYYLAIGGPLTYRNAGQLSQVASAAPADRLVVETDCPYLTPHPHRGQRNEPGFVRLVVEKIAALRGESVDAIARQTTHNACMLFGLS